MRNLLIVIVVTFLCLSLNLASAQSRCVDVLRAVTIAERLNSSAERSLDRIIDRYENAAQNYERQLQRYDEAISQAEADKFAAEQAGAGANAACGMIFYSIHDLTCLIRNTQAISRAVAQATSRAMAAQRNKDNYEARAALALERLEQRIEDARVKVELAVLELQDARASLTQCLRAR